MTHTCDLNTYAKYVSGVVSESPAESRKQKLTLSVDSDVVEKAKKLGLNMSEITERILTTYTFEPKKAENETVYQKYQEFFDMIVPVLKKYDIWLGIARQILYDESQDPATEESFTLSPDGNIFGDGPNRQVKDLHEIYISSFYSPNKILISLIDAMANVAEQNKQRLKDLEFARRIVEAITDTRTSDGEGSSTTKTQGRG